ncbi:MAG: GDP-mannose mannosyl hydrolase [Pontibacterium sp.]
MTFLDKDTFKAVVANAPLVSLDLIVKDSDGHVLLGRRNNRPAKGNWFVPGGRILKGEAVDVAIERLTKDELGRAYQLNDTSYHGLYDHFYVDSIWGDEVSTHYLVNAFVLQVDPKALVLPMAQHNDYKWFTIEELLSSDEVHIHTKWYFQENKAYS